MAPRNLLPARKTATLLVLTLVPAFVFSGCMRDFSQFAADGGAGDGDGLGGDSNPSGGNSGDGDGDTGGVSGDGDGDTGGMSGDGDGDTGGNGTGGAGGSGDGCEAGQKLCGEDCVPNDDPSTGCDGASCSACPTQTNAMIGCEAGACAVVGCSSGFADCDDTGGCEHSLGALTPDACGGCDANCADLGLAICADGACGCSQPDQCKYDNPGNGTLGCTAGLCSCSGTECNPGERCKKTGATAICQCNADGPCAGGFACCPGASGATCENINGSDASNCGACGWQCGPGEVCSSGSCVPN